MERLHRIVQVAAPYLVLSALAVIAVQRVTESPAAAAPTTVVEVPPRVTESRVVHVHDDRTPSRVVVTQPQRPTVNQQEPAAEVDEEPPEAEPETEEQAELRAERLERGHVLVDGMLDSGVAEADAAHELRGIVENLPHADRIQLYARITSAVNEDELEVDPDHLPL